VGVDQPRVKCHPEPPLFAIDMRYRIVVSG
jgi:hypothetical protein